MQFSLLGLFMANEKLSIHPVDLLPLLIDNQQKDPVGISYKSKLKSEPTNPNRLSSPRIWRFAEWMQSQPRSSDPELRKMEDVVNMGLLNELLVLDCMDQIVPKQLVLSNYRACRLMMAIRPGLQIRDAGFNMVSLEKKDPYSDIPHPPSPDLAIVNNANLVQFGETTLQNNSQYFIKKIKQYKDVLDYLESNGQNDILAMLNPQVCLFLIAKNVYRDDLQTIQNEINSDRRVRKYGLDMVDFKPYPFTSVDFGHNFSELIYPDSAEEIVESIYSGDTRREKVRINGKFAKKGQDVYIDPYDRGLGHSKFYKPANTG